MIGIYLITVGTIILVASVSWEYYIKRIQNDLSLNITPPEGSDQEVDRSELPAIGSEEAESQEETDLLTIGYSLSFLFGIFGLFLFLGLQITGSESLTTVLVVWAGLIDILVPVLWYIDSRDLIEFLWFPESRIALTLSASLPNFVILLATQGIV
ncbi:hypothetical protein [Natronorubrum sp. FCH18a]|uniref:hypothetical protein n=1 Tax=Natronorubrum sp. FCH18a TaxID=3447018 RepID=UPI003F511923